MSTNEVLVSVRGEAELECDPEIATLTVTLRVVDKARDEAVARLAQRQTALAAALDEFGKAIERRESAALWVQPITKGREQKPTAYSAQLQVAVTIGAPATVGDVASRCSSLDDASVTGPWWALKPDSSAYAEVRAAAARDAVARARHYASALGARVVAMLELADVGLLGESRAQAVSAPMFAARARDGVDDVVPALDLEPRRQRVQAQVEARFTMSQPPLRL